MMGPGPKLDAARAIVDQAAVAAGRDPVAIGMEGRINTAIDPDAAAAELAAWAEAGASHVSVNTMGQGLRTVDDHLAALSAVADRLPGDFGAAITLSVTAHAEIARVLADRRAAGYSRRRSTEDRRSPRNRLKVRDCPGGPRRRTRLLLRARPDLSVSGRSSFPASPSSAPAVPIYEEACMAKADKATAVADIAEQFKEASATLVTEYRGLTVANLKDLRRSLGDSATYTVAKNTLVKRAAAEAGIEGLDELFVGPTAIAFVKGEAVDAAKAIKKFAKDNKALVIKGGYMDGRPLSVSEVETIADLESREVLLAKLAGAMKANLSKAAGLFNAPASQVARLVAALQEKKAAEARSGPEDSARRSRRSSSAAEALGPPKLAAEASSEDSAPAEAAE